VSDLVAQQSDEHVWKNSLKCANCQCNLAEHCRVHLIPCCPGKCPGADD
jgi:hypothetical protein